MGYPNKCEICPKDRALEGFGESLQLTVKPFHHARDPQVMLLGLNPTLIRKEARVVLELDDSHSQIYRFVVGDVLTPIGIGLKEHVYATNLIKCTFFPIPHYSIYWGNLSQREPPFL